MFFKKSVISLILIFTLLFFGTFLLRNSSKDDYSFSLDEKRIYSSDMNFEFVRKVQLDSLYILNLKSDSEKIYGIDYSNLSITVFNQDLVKIKSYAEKGSGPHEFQSIRDISFNQGKIYIYDRSALALKIYDNQFNFIRMEKLFLPFYKMKITNNYNRIISAGNINSDTTKFIILNNKLEILSSFDDTVMNDYLSITKQFDIYEFDYYFLINYYFLGIVSKIDKQSLNLNNYILMNNSISKANGIKIGKDYQKIDTEATKNLMPGIFVHKNQIYVFSSIKDRNHTREYTFDIYDEDLNYLISKKLDINHNLKYSSIVYLNNSFYITSGDYIEKYTFTD